MARMVSEADRELLEERVIVCEGESPFDVVGDPGSLLRFAQEQGVGTVVIDSLKDLADKLSDEAVGSAINRAMQLLVADGIEVLPLHHHRKAQAENKKPKQFPDVYGSRWLTAGCGSVVTLWGDPGDPIVELSHLKQPAEVVGPLTVHHDQSTGRMTVQGGTDVVDLLAEGVPLTAKEMAKRLHASEDRNAVAKVKRRLDSAVKEGRAERRPTKDGEPATWTLKEGCTQGVHGGCTQGVHGEGARSALRSRGACTPVDDGVNGGCTTAADDSGQEAPPPRSDDELEALAPDEDDQPPGPGQGWLSLTDTADAEEDHDGEWSPRWLRATGTGHEHPDRGGEGHRQGRRTPRRRHRRRGRPRADLGAVVRHDRPARRCPAP